VGSDAHELATEEPAPRHWLTRGVGSVGLASFFSDSGHEIATSMLPTFITVTLRSSASVLGVIEGISDALTGVAKLIAGPLANDESRRLRMATGGYLVTAAATGAIGLATTVFQVGLARAAAWLARGVRSPARDAMLAQLAPREAYGRAYGLERAGDNLGAVVGPLLAAALVTAIGIRHTIYLSVVPGLFAALAITIAAREARRNRSSASSVARRARLELRGLRDAGALRPLLPIGAFELGNVATTLLILRATTLLHHGDRSITAATSLAVLIYAGHNLVAALVAYGGGHWLDRAGPRIVFAAGAAVYVAGYALFALPLHTWPILVAAFLLAGSGIGSPKRPSPRSWPACCPTGCVAAASASSAACSHSATSPPRPPSEYSGPPSRRPLRSFMRPAGCWSRCSRQARSTAGVPSTTRRGKFVTGDEARLNRPPWLMASIDYQPMEANDQHPTPPA
jgi:MFS family permease